MLDRINENLVDIDKTTEKDLVESVISLYLWVFTKNPSHTSSNILSGKIYLICFDIKIIATFVP